MNPSSSRLLFLLLATAILLSATVWGQIPSGSVEGIVYDPSGAVVPDAGLTARNTATGASFSARSDAAGFYRFPVLPVGTYDISVERSGFATVTQSGVGVTVGARVTVNVTLAVGATAEEVTITSRPPIVETTRTQVSATVDERAISSLPVNGRNFIDFVLLTPGVTRDVRTGDISFAGQRGTLNSLTVDGSDNNNSFFGQTVGRTGSGRAPYQFSNDAVQEFQVNSNSYSAELGRAGGAVVNVVTKSGTNEFHGTAFWFYRDRAMNATDTIDRLNNRRKAPYHFNQFGGNIGGPVQRDKLFFFFNYDGQRNTLPNSVFLNLPAGFTLSADPVVAGFQQTALDYLNQRSQSWVRTQNQNVYLVKMDWHISPRHILTGRWNNQRFTGGGFENGGPQNSFEHTGASLVKTDSISASLTSTVSPRMVNVARFTFLRDKEPGLANSENPEANIFQGGQLVLTIGRNFFSPRETTIKRGQWADTLTYTTGRHTWKVGGDVIVDRILNFFPGNFSGSYRFNSLESFGRNLAGSPAPIAGENFVQAFAGADTSGPTTRPDIFEVSFFAQDDIRVRPNLTLNLGLRYDLQKVAQGDVTNPAASLAAAGIDTAFIRNDKNNFGPRAGFAWTPWMNTPLVVRGGYGVFYGRTPSIMVGTAHSNNGLNVRTITYTGADIPRYPNTQCGPPVPSPDCAPPAGGTTPIPTIFIFQNDYSQPFVQQGNFGMELEVRSDMAVAINYLFVRGTQLQRTRNINLGSTSVQTIGIANSGTVLSYDAFTGPRPLPDFARIAQFESDASSVYHGMVMQLNKRFSHNFQFLGSYTWGKVIDEVPDATAVVPFGSDDAKMVYNPANPRLDRAVGVNDQRHRFVLSWVWDLNYAGQLPAGARAVLSGWEVSGILTAQSGQPYSGLVNFDLNGDGNSRHERTPGQPRNTFNLPGLVSLDPRVQRTVPLTERMRMQFIFEGFNILNRSNLTAVNTTQYSRSTSAAACGIAGTPCLVPSALFQRPTVSAGPRILQLAAKISF